MAGRLFGGRPATLRRRFTPRVEGLEERTVPASIYVDDVYLITQNVGPPALSPGDIVTWHPGLFGQVGGLVFGTNAFKTISEAVAVADSGDKIKVGAGNIFETQQTIIADGFDIDIVGFGPLRTRIIANFNTAADGPGRGWFLVSDGATLNATGIGLNGINGKVADAIRFAEGSLGGTIDSVNFLNIRRTPAEFDGVGINIKSGNVDVMNCTFQGIGRIGVQYLNDGTTGEYCNNVHMGRGAGNFIEHAIEVGDGANVVISGNRISNIRSKATIGGEVFESAAILVDTLGGPAAVATIFGNSITGNLNGIFVGVDELDGIDDISIVTAHHNNITGNTFGVFVTDATSSVDAERNWWGSVFGPKHASNPAGKGDVVGDFVDFTPFADRVQAILCAPTEVGYAAELFGLVAVGAGGAGVSPPVRIFDAAGVLKSTVSPFPDFGGKLLQYGANVAIGDVTGDGIPDLVAGVGRGGGGLLRVYDGVSGLRIRSYSFRFGVPGGVNVAIGDINADGVGDVIASAASGISYVLAFSGRTGGLLRLFQAFPGTKGGVSVASGDVNGDGYDDLILGSGVGALPSVKVVSGKSPFATLLLLTAPYAADVIGGLNVTAGDFNGDGRADIVTSVAAGSSGPVRVFNGANGSLLFEVDPFPGFDGGLNIAAADTNGDGIADIIVAPASGLPPDVRIFSGFDQSELPSFLAFALSFDSGITVGAV